VEVVLAMMSELQSPMTCQSSQPSTHHISLSLKTWIGFVDDPMLVVCLEDRLRGRILTMGEWEEIGLEVEVVVHG
jgi:hypothetical protein